MFQPGPPYRRPFLLLSETSRGLGPPNASSPTGATIDHRFHRNLGRFIEPGRYPPRGHLN
jgi:hypothetical protein